MRASFGRGVVHGARQYWNRRLFGAVVSGARRRYLVGVAPNRTRCARPGRDPTVSVIHGRYVSYTEAGAGPVLLLVHGMAGTAENWRQVIEPLALRNTVIAPDFPGHGLSGARRRRLLASAASPAACATCCSRSATSARRWSATASAAASRCSSPTSSRSWSSAWCWSPAAASGPTSARSCGPRRCPAPTSSSPPPPGPAARSARCSAAASALVGLRPNADVAEVARGYASLADAERRKAFLATLRAVVGTERPARRRPRPPLPGRGAAAPDRLGRARPDHPGLPRRSGAPTSSPAAASRSSTASATCPSSRPRPLRRRPRTLPRRDRAGRVRPRRVARPLQDAPSGTPRRARQDSNLRPLPPEGSALSS